VPSVFNVVGVEFVDYSTCYCRGKKLNSHDSVPADMYMSIRWSIQAKLLHFKTKSCLADVHRSSFSNTQ